MPLDGHSYLVAQGWGGKGTGLRQGAISRPLAIPQKKTLAGLGKDRDDAFPFWDHLFSAAAKSIQVKCLSDEEDEGDGTSTPKDDVVFKRTSTGILSTRRPIDGTPAHSGTATPNDVESDSQTSRLSLIAQAKRDAAKRGLYSRFFRGPVLGPETIAEEERRLEALISKALDDKDSKIKSIKVTEHIEVQLADAQVVVDLKVKSKSSKKRKARDGEEDVEGDEEKAARKERKRRKKQEKEAKEKLKKERKEKEKEKKESSKASETSASAEFAEPSKSEKYKHSKRPQEDESSSGDSEEERKRRKKEKKRLKALHEQAEKGAANDVAEESVAEKKESSSRSRKEKSSKVDSGKTTSLHEIEQKEEKKKKKKWKKQTGSDE